MVSRKIIVMIFKKLNCDDFSRFHTLFGVILLENFDYFFDLTRFQVYVISGRGISRGFT